MAEYSANTTAGQNLIGSKIRALTLIPAGRNNDAILDSVSKLTDRYQELVQMTA